MDLLVTTDWLATNLHREDVKILDGTWVLPKDEPTLAPGYVPRAQVFDCSQARDYGGRL